MDFQTLDSIIASALMNILHEDFRKRVLIEEERGQQKSRFMTRRQDAWMIYDQSLQDQRHGRHSSASLKSLESRTQSDNVQSFDTRWDETIITMAKKLDDEVLETRTSGSSTK